MLLFAAWRIGSVRIDSDMSAFLPRGSTAEQSALLNAFGAGPSSRMWLLAVHSEDSEESVRWGKRLIEELNASGLFSNVLSGGAAPDSVFQETLFRYRYLLDPDAETARFTAAELRRALVAAEEQLHSPASPFQELLIASDPTGAMTRVLDTLVPASFDTRGREGVWLSDDGKWAFVLAETHAEGADLDAQERVAERIREFETAARADGRAALTVSGPPAFAVAAKASIQRETIVLSLTSLALLVGILYAMYRRIALVALIYVPILGGILAGVLVTSTIWGSIHGISLAFGTILLGVSLDYPIHLLSHVRSNEGLSESGARIWPTLRLGVLTTVLGFAAMLTSGFDGIRQLAVFAICGLICAALLTRYLLASARVSPGPQSTRSRRFTVGTGRFGSVVCGLILVILLLAAARAWYEPDAIFRSDIDDLSPMPAELLRRDLELREMMGLAEPGHLLLVRGADVESVLAAQEAILPLLERAMDLGYVDGFDMAANVLPSQARQLRRRSLLPPRVSLSERMAEASRDFPFRPGVFQPFIDDVAMSRELQLLDEETLAGSVLETRLNNLLRRDPDGVTGLVTLAGVSNPTDFAALMDAGSGVDVRYVNVNATTNDLINGYRDNVLLRSVMALAAISLVLALVLRDWRRLLRVLAPVLGAMLTAAAVPILLGQALSLFHLISLLLVVGIGLDYALFLSRPRSGPAEFAATMRSVAVCGLSTTTVFAILAFSTIPVLRFIGVTVAIGAVAAFFLSARISTTGQA